MARVLQRSVGKVPFQHVTLRAEDGLVKFFHDDSGVHVAVRLCPGQGGEDRICKVRAVGDPLACEIGEAAIALTRGL